VVDPLRLADKGLPELAKALARLFVGADLPVEAHGESVLLQRKPVLAVALVVDLMRSVALAPEGLPPVV